MAKESKIKLIGMIITVAFIFAGIVGTWAIYGADIKNNTEDITELEVDGCKPSVKNTGDIKLINYRLDEFSKGQIAIRKDTKELLRRLPK